MSDKEQKDETKGERCGSGSDSTGLVIRSCDNCLSNLPAKTLAQRGRLNGWGCCVPFNLKGEATPYQTFDGYCEAHHYEKEAWLEDAYESINKMSSEEFETFINDCAV